MVGRSREFSQLTGAVAAKRGAVITGPAGVGKTTLALSGVEWAEQRGMAHRRASATRAAQGLPFGAFASLLPPERSEADSAREDLGVLLGRYARAMVEEAQGRPLLVFVDDAHLLDNGSAILVHQLALTQAATVLATVRAGEVLPDPVLSLWKDGPAERIEIGVLDDETIEELLVSALGGPVDAATVRELAARSRGKSDVPARAGQWCARGVDPTPYTRGVPAPDQPWHQWRLFGLRCYAHLFGPSCRGGRASHYGPSRTRGSSRGRSEGLRRRLVRPSIASRVGPVRPMGSTAWPRTSSIRSANAGHGHRSQKEPKRSRDL